jgi:hypothetical protein
MTARAGNARIVRLFRGLADNVSMSPPDAGLVTLTVRIDGHPVRRPVHSTAA